MTGSSVVLWLHTQEIAHTCLPFSPQVQEILALPLGTYLARPGTPPKDLGTPMLGKICKSTTPIVGLFPGDSGKLEKFATLPFWQTSSHKKRSLP